MSASSTKQSSFELTCGRVPIIVHVPHASTWFPKSELDGATLNSDVNVRESAEILADRHTDVLAERIIANTRLRPYIFSNTVSRLFMDPERFDSPDEIMNTVGMGITYEKNHALQNLYTEPLSPEQIRRRKDVYYAPYADMFSRTVDHVLNTFGKCLILDLHSYASTRLPYESSDAERAPLIIGYEDYHLSALENTVDDLAAQDHVGVNTVFSGSYVPLDHYRQDPRVSSVMTEIRKDTYMDEKSGAMQDSPLLDGILENVATLATDYLAREFPDLVLEAPHSQS